MVDFILLLFTVAIFFVGVWVGATYGGIQTLYGKMKNGLRKKLDDEAPPPNP